jgi:hypothetical protein
MSAREYAASSDWQILNVLFAERDDDHYLIPIKRRLREREIRRRVSPEVYQASPLPISELNVPPEALDLMPPFMSQGYVSMFWQTAKRYGFDDATVLQRWKDFAAKDFNEGESLAVWPGA